MARSSKKKEKKYIYIIPVILWMTFIFYMSAKTGEGSSAVSNPITDLVYGYNICLCVFRRDTSVVCCRQGRQGIRCAYRYVWSGDSFAHHIRYEKYKGKSSYRIPDRYSIGGCGDVSAFVAVLMGI